MDANGENVRLITSNFFGRRAGHPTANNALITRVGSDDILYVINAEGGESTAITPLSDVSGPFVGCQHYRTNYHQPELRWKAHRIHPCSITCRNPVALNINSPRQPVMKRTKRTTNRSGSTSSPCRPTRSITSQVSARCSAACSAACSTSS